MAEKVFPRRALMVAACLVPFLFSLACTKPEEPQSAETAGGIKEKTSGESIAVDVNSPAPAFAAKVMGGGELKLADHVGKVVLLEFWSVFCKSCLEEMPAVRELHRRYRDQGFEVISVNTDAFSDARVRGVLEKAGMVFDYPVVRDLRKDVSAAYNVQLLPVTVIIDRSGWIRLYQEGYRMGEEVKFEKVVRKYLDATGREDVTLAPRAGQTRFAPLVSAPALPKLAAEVVKKTSEGGEVRIGKKRPAVLFFWSLYCQPCREEIPLIDRLRNTHADSGVDFIAVNVDSEKLADRVKKFLAPYPGIKSVSDTGGAGVPLSEQLGVNATPTVVLLDSTGAVVHVANGVAQGSALDEKIAALAGGK